MANVTIPNLTSATTIAPSTDLMVLEQTEGTRKATLSQIFTSSATSGSGLGITSGGVYTIKSGLDSDISDINTLLGNTSIASIGDGTVTGAVSQINSDLTPSSTQQISPTYSDQYFESSCIKVGKLVVCSVLTKCSNTLNDTIVTYGRLPYAVKELLEFGWTPLAQNASFSATSVVSANSKDINLQISGTYNADTYMRANFVYVTNE